MAGPRDPVDEVRRRIEERVRLHETLGNFHRFIILALIALRKKASWNEIKWGVEQLCGSINPNTLAFHLDKLLGRGFVKKEGDYYLIVEDKLPKEVGEILQSLGDALRKVGEGISKNVERIKSSRG